MKKIVSIILLLASILLLYACVGDDAVLDETKTYEIKSEIHSLDIRINAADFKIVSADKFLVKSNLKYLSVSEKDGVLKIADEAKSNSNYSGAILTLYVPNGAVFNDVDIETGAAKMTVDTLSTDSLKFTLGAGDVLINNMNVSSSAEISGGAGKFVVSDGAINNLGLEMGAGELNMRASLSGNCEFSFGVGEANMTLIGGKENYKVNIDKGIGSITVDGSSVTDFAGSGNGQNYIRIEGGVGAINLNFEKKDH